MFERTDLVMPGEIQNALDLIIKEHREAIWEGGPYFRVEISVWSGDDDNTVNRIAYYEVRRTAHPAEQPTE